MKSIMRMRHYCDFCKKSGATKPRMAKHEKGCTKNPSRLCGLCTISGNVQEPMDVLRAVFAAEGFPALVRETHDCPACILAVLRQANDDDPTGEEGFWFGGWDDPKNKGRVEWNFKAEMKKFWADYNDSQDRDFG